MEMENPYGRVLQGNMVEKEAVLKSVTSVIPKEVLSEIFPSEIKNVKLAKPKKKNVPVKSSPYKTRVPQKKDNNFHPFRRISPRVMKGERKSLEENSLADQTMVVNIKESPARPEGVLKLEDQLQYVENDDWSLHLKGVAHYPHPPVSDDHCPPVQDLEVKGKHPWLAKTQERNNWRYPKKGPVSLDRFKEEVSKLSIMCGSVSRVVNERIASMAVHPSKEKLVIAVGGRMGFLGLWIVDPVLGAEGGFMKNNKLDKSGTGIYRFKLHGEQINCATFCAFQANRLITSSYDGTVRSLDFERGVSDQLVSFPTDMGYYWMQWHTQLSSNIFLASQGTGNVYVLDNRTSSPYEALLKCHDRSCRSVSLHPLHPVYMATCSSTGYLSVCDLRKFGRNASKVNLGAAVVHLPLRTKLSSAFFSPVTGSGLLVTESNEVVRIYDTSKLIDKAQSPSVFRMETEIKHNHKSSQWLTLMRATWHPDREDAFVIGSTANPRQVNVIGRHGRQLCALGRDGPLPMNTVCPVNQFHPNRMMLASADSGGRVHILL